MKPLSENLTVLIATAEDVTRRPHDLPARLPDTFGALAAEVRHAHSLPAESIRTTYAASVMVEAIEAFFAGRSDHHWQMIIGTTLPVLRREAWQALRNEKEQNAPEEYRR